MESNRTQLWIAASAGALLLMIFFGYLISLNPLRDRNSERFAAKYLDAMRNGQCKEELAKWEHDYRRKYAAFICDSEAKHPLVSWKLVDWEDAPPLRILHYRGKRRTNQGQPDTYKELFSITLENQDGAWEVTKYDAMY